MLDDAGRALVEEFSSFAGSLAWEYWRKAPRVDVAELEGIALLALAEAVEGYPVYCARRGFDPARRDFLAAYATRRMRGAILDWARSQDHVTRTQRQVLKAIEAAGLPGATAAELAGVAGVTEDEVRAAQAAQASKPVYLADAADGTYWPGGSHPPDPGAEVESVAAVRAVTGAAARAFAGLPLEQQVVLVRVFMHGQDLGDVAAVLGITAWRARRPHESAVLAIHSAMLSVADGGCGCGNGNGNGNGSCSCPAR